MCPKRHGNGSIGPSNATRNQRGHQEIAATAAILFGDRDPRVALVSQAFPHPAREIVATFNFGIMRSNLVSSKSKSTFIGKLMLFRKFKIHGLPILSGVANKAFLDLVVRSLLSIIRHLS